MTVQDDQTEWEGVRQPRPSFDSTVKALRFAFNADAAFVSPPTMNKMMAAVNLQGTPIKKKEEEKYWADQAGERKPSVVPQPGQLFRGFDRAAQAGIILRQVMKLEPHRQEILTARFVEFRKPCACRSPCCCGFRYSLQWITACSRISEYLKDRADLMRKPGKRGMSSEPRLRDALVKSFFSPLKPPTLTDLAGIAEIDVQTAAKHRTLILSHLWEEEGEALGEISVIFDQVGVTGFLD